MSDDHYSFSHYLRQPDRYVPRVIESKGKQGVKVEKNTLFTRLKAHLPWLKDQYKSEKVLNVLHKADTQENPQDFRILQLVAKKLKNPPTWYQEQERSEALNAFKELSGPDVSRWSGKFVKNK